MHIHTCLVSYNRLHLTRQAIDTYLATVTSPFSLVVVDNGSDRETCDWLAGDGRFSVVLLGENRYPGYATNRGFELAPAETTLLHRADNDFTYLPGWCDEVERRFRQQKRLGQLGLRTDKEELFNAFNVGGNAVFRKTLWDQGMRYIETPWEQLGGTTEDYYASYEVETRGYLWRRVRVPCIVNLATGDWNDEYYQQSFGIRGITRPEEDE